VGEVLLSRGDLRAPILSLSVVRDDDGLEEEFEWFMRLWGTYLVLFLILDLEIAWRLYISHSLLHLYMALHVIAARCRRQIQPST
jgi:hypothetical protein